MSTSNTDRRRTFTGDGSDNSPYSLATFPMRRDEDIEIVYVTDATGVEVVKTVTTDYTVSIASDWQSATVTLVTTAPASGETLLIRRTGDFFHQENYQAHDGQPADILDADFDENMLQRLAVLEKTDRALLVAKGHPDANLPLDPINMIGNDGKTPTVNDAETGWELGVVTEDAVAGPDDDTSTDNAIVRWDGTTGRLIQNSVVIMDDSGNITGASSITGSGTLSMDADGSNTHIIGVTKAGGLVPDHAGWAHFDHFSLAANALNQTSAGQTNLNAPTGQLVALSINSTHKVEVTATEVSLKTGVDLDVSDGDIDLSGVITAGSGSTVLTSTAGDLLLAAIEQDGASTGDHMEWSGTTWAPVAPGGGFGDLSGPGSSTDNAVARFDGTTGKLVQNGVVIIGDAGAVTGVTTLTGSGVITMASDADGTHTLGRGKIGTVATDHIGFSHFDHFTLAGHAIGQTSAGITTVNAPVGQEVQISIGFTAKVDVNTSSVTLNSGMDLTVSDGDLEVSAGTITSINGAGSGTSPDSSANDIVLNSATSGGYSLLTPDGSFGVFAFGSPSDTIGAKLQWQYSGDVFSVGTNKVGASTILRGDNNVINATLSGASGSELATFAGDVTIGPTAATPLTVTGGSGGLQDGLRVYRNASTTQYFDMGTTSASGTITHTSTSKRFEFDNAGTTPGEYRWKIGGVDQMYLLTDGTLDVLLGDLNVTAGDLEVSAGDSTFDGLVILDEGAQLTPTVNAITVTNSFHDVIGGPVKDLDTINIGSVEGQVLYLYCNGVIVTIKNGTGNITTNTGADVVFASTEIMHFIYAGGNWRLVNGTNP